MKPKTLSLQDTVSWSANQLATDVAGEVVLLSIDRGAYYGLDDIGSVIWRRMEKPTAIADLCASLAAEFNGEPETIRRDVLALLDGLLDQGLITRVG